MSSFALSVFALAGALIAQAVAAGLATELFLRKGRPSLARRSWLALAIGSLLLAPVSYTHLTLPTTILV